MVEEPNGEDADRVGTALLSRLKARFLTYRKALGHHIGRWRAWSAARMRTATAAIFLTLTHPRRWLSGIVSLVRGTVRFLVGTLAFGVKTIAGFIIVSVIVVMISNSFLATDRDRPYRNVDPLVSACKADGFGWKVLAGANNDELEAIGADKSKDWTTRFSCALQTHTIPPPSKDGARLAYHLAFLEFRENGDPYELIPRLGKRYTIGELSERVRYWNRRSREPLTQVHALSQHLRQVRANGNFNYVIVFVHGWRHDSRIGDTNVADLRTYAAHAARFLHDRCQWGEQDACKTKVTAVYFGWRGARVDERRVAAPFVWAGRKLEYYLGSGAKPYSTRYCALDEEAPEFEQRHKSYYCKFVRIGQGMSSALMWITLFDRKPVSEDIAPHALMALRSIESALGDTGKSWKKDVKVQRIRNGGTDDEPSFRERRTPVYSSANPAGNKNKLIVFGHSLGGNMLITAIGDVVKKRFRLHPRIGKDHFDSPVGNLIVLINPAAEASKWTGIQREVWSRIAFRVEDALSIDKLIAGHRLFPQHQRPAIVSVTSAFAWPPGGIRIEDCAYAATAGKAFLDEGKDHAKGTMRTINAERSLRPLLKSAINDANNGLGRSIEYDWATYDLFPLFKLDFRPAADRVDRFADWWAHGRARPKHCEQRAADSGIIVKTLRLLAAGVRDFPFQNRDKESTRTIGHLDVPRHVTGRLYDYLTSAKPLGTTHEIRGGGAESLVPYAEIAGHPNAHCGPSHYWLTRAKRHPRRSNGTGWSSNVLSDMDKISTIGNIPAYRMTSSSPRVRFQHGYDLAGIQPITRANDPFWNMRAYDDVLAKHDGFLLSSFICGMNQLVMDEPTLWPAKKVQAVPEVSRISGVKTK